MNTDYPEDKRKLHAEITQIVNQRFLLTTGSVAVIGVILGRIAPDLGDLQPNTVNKLVPSSVVATTILGSLFWQSHRLRLMLRVLTAYLIARGWSLWELDWRKYRAPKPKCAVATEQPAALREGRSHLDVKANASVFAILTMLSTIFPFGIALWRFGPSILSLPVISALLLGLSLLLSIWRLSSGTYWDKREKEFSAEWEPIIKADVSKELNRKA